MTAFQTLPDPAWIHNETSGRILDVNVAALKNYGYSRKAFLSLSVGNLERGNTATVPPGLATSLQNGLQPVNSVNGASVHYARDGAEMNVTLHSAPMQWRGQNARIVTSRQTPLSSGKVMSDRIVTEAGAGADPANADLSQCRFQLTHLEQVLRQKENWLENAQRIADIGYWELDLTAKTLVWTEPVFHIFGVPLGTALGSFDFVRKMIHPDDVDLYVRMRDEAIAEELPFQSVHRIVRPDGTIRNVHELGRLSQGPNGPVFSGVVKDITETFSIAQQAQEQTRLLDTAGRVAKFGGWRISLLDRSVSWSKQIADLHALPEGYSPSVEEGVSFFAPEFREQSDDLLRECMINGTAYDEIMQIISATGKAVWVRSIGEAVTDTEGRITAVQGAMQDVTELVEAQHQTKYLNDWLQLTNESIGESFLMLDADWRVTYLNTNAADFLKHSKADLVGQVLWAVCPEVAGNGFETSCRDAVESQKSVHFSDHLESIQKWIEVKALPTAMGLSVYFSDVTRQHLRESRLRLLQAAVDRVNDLIIITDAEPFGAKDGPKIVFANSAYYRRTGYAPNEVIGKSPRILQGPNSQAGEIKRVSDAMREWRTVRADVINYTKSGEEFWMELDIVPIGDKAGKYTHWVSIQRDITERKLAEEALRLSDERFNMVAKATNDVFWDWRIAADALWWNDSARKVFGYDSQIVSPGYQRWKNCVHPDDLSRFTETMAQAIGGNASIWTCEYRFRRADTSYAIIVDKGYISRDAAGTAVRMVGSMSDVTETRRLEASLRESVKLEAIGRLTGGIAHDFNNLLTVILGTADLMLDRLTDRPALTKMIDTTIAAAERGAELTQYLLAFARQQPLESRPISANTVLQSALPLFRQAIHAGIDLVFSPAENLSRALVDPGQLVNAVLNLVINSRDAMPNGGTITIKTLNALIKLNDDPAAVIPKDAEYVLIEVSDTGEGMTADVKAHAFDPFFTTKATGLGSGLGLSMVYGFMKQSNGLARIASEVGIGTSVRLYLPRTLELEPEIEGPEEPPLPPGHGEHILMAEDDDDLRTLVRGQLVALGYKVTAVANAAEALMALAQEQDISLLFTDIIMPGELGGRGLASEAQRLYPNLKVLFTSGYMQDAPEPYAQPPSEIMLLSKPYRRRELARTIRAVLDTPQAAFRHPDGRI